MTSGPRAHDAEETPTSTDESLEEFTERTAEVMDDARKQVNRARETFHDQIMGGPGSEVLDYQDHGSAGEPRETESESKSESEPGSESESKSGSKSESKSESESDPDAKGDDTKAAWPNWT